VRRLRRLALTGLLASGLVWGASTAVGAQPQGPSQNDFRPMTPEDLAQQEHLPATPLVFSAYGFVWLALATYVFTLWRRVARVERELGDVTARLGARRR
jgi:CcmD family protein